MQCPIDGTQLVMTHHTGVEIDCCPQCRGEWLDRGELDQIIKRSAAPTAPAPRMTDKGYEDARPAYRKKKRGGFLEDILDF